MRGPMINRPPSPNRPASKEIIAAWENCECAPCNAGSVTPSNTSPAAVSVSPIHWRRPTWKPNIFSAITAMNTMPAASDTWITDIGAIASAATCSPQLAVAITMPSANHFDEYNPRAERSGWRICTFATELAPRYLKKNPRFATNAQARARRMPRSRVMMRRRYAGTIGCSQRLLYCLHAISADRPSQSE